MADTSHFGDYTTQRHDAPLPESGDLLLFYGALADSEHQAISNNIRDSRWKSLNTLCPGARLNFNSLSQLSRALDLACANISRSALQQIRVTTIQSQQELSSEQLLSAMQRVEYLPELLSRLSRDWLQDLLRHPEHFFNEYQPLIDLRNGGVFAYEMLIRARGRSNEGTINGGQLVNAAVGSRMVHAFDSMARAVAIKTASRCFNKSTNVFINLMPNSIVDADRAIERTLQTCESVRLEPSRIVFEVVETESIRDIDMLRHVLRDLRHKGFKFALDDLGSGYSGLSYMLELRPDYVKLDRGIVDGSADDRAKRIVITKLVEAAHEIGIRVVAEGVETLEDFDCVRELGCDLVQGYFVARPGTVVYPEGHNLLQECLSRTAVA